MSKSTVGLLFVIWLIVYLIIHWKQRRSRVPDKRSTLRQDWLAIGGLALAVLLFFWRQLFTNRAWFPAGGGDLASFIYPMLQFTGRSLRSGILPLWNPYLYGGAPFISDNQSMLLYPINWIFLISNTEITYRLVQNIVIFHILLAGMGMYFCLRHLAHRLLRFEAALTGAIAYMFSGVFLIHLGNLNLIAVAAWLPWVFLFFYRALEKNSLGQAALSGLFLALAASAGHIQIFLFIVLLLVTYTLFWIATRPRHMKHQSGEDKKQTPAVKAAGMLVLTLIIAGAVAAPALLPSLEMVQFTKRANLSYQEASAFSLPPAKLIGLLVPSFFERDPSLHWGPWDRVEIGYIGIFPLVLALLAILLRRNRINRFLLLLSAGALLVAFGGYSIVHGWFYEIVPGFDRLRAPARIVLLLDFGLAALAAQGLDTLLRPLNLPQRRSWRQFLRLAPWMLFGTILFVAPLAYYTLFLGQEKDPVIFFRISQGVNGIILFLFFLSLSFLFLALRRWRWIRNSVVMGLLAALLVLIDLGSTGAYLDIARKAPTQGFDHPEIISFLKQDFELYRIDSRTDIWHLWQPDTPLLHDIGDVWGVVNPLTLADYDRYWENMGSRSSPLYDFLNAKYVIAAKDVELDWSKFDLVFEGDPDLNVYANRDVLPRAFTVHNATITSNQKDAFAAIHEESFDPSGEVVVERGRELPQTNIPDQKGTVRFIGYSPNHIELGVEMPQAGYLVLSEVYYPGWQARVNGRTTPIYRANYAFRAIYLEPGTHHVTLTFRPLTWYLGLGISGVTIILILVWAVVSWRRRP